MVPTPKLKMIMLAIPLLEISMTTCKWQQRSRDKKVSGSTVCGCKRLEITRSFVSRDWLNRLGVFTLYATVRGKSPYELEGSPGGWSKKSKVPNSMCAVLTFAGEPAFLSVSLYVGTISWKDPPATDHNDRLRGSEFGDRGQTWKGNFH